MSNNHEFQNKIITNIKKSLICLIAKLGMLPPYLNHLIEKESMSNDYECLFISMSGFY